MKDRVKTLVLGVAMFLALSVPVIVFGQAAAVDVSTRARILALDGYALFLGVEDDADGGIQLYAEDAIQARIKNGVITPETDNDVDLGTSTVEFKDAFFDGKVKTDALEVDVSDITATASGVTLALQEATAGAKCMGTATANGTTAVTVSTTCATTGSRIFLTRSSAPSGTAQCWQTNIQTGVSFDLDCDGAETGTFDWLIIHEAA